MNIVRSDGGAGPLENLTGYSGEGVRGEVMDGNVDETAAFADVLAAKGISHECDLWGHDVSHEWTWWKRQARHHLLRLIANTS